MIIKFVRHVGLGSNSKYKEIGGVSSSGPCIKTIDIIIVEPRSVDCTFYPFLSRVKL